MGEDISDSVYKEAVTKLKVLLNATEQPTLRMADIRRQHERSKSLEQLYTDQDRARGEDELSQGTPRRHEPMFVKLPPRQPSSSVRRQLFTGGQGKRLRGRHNSWHNLTSGQDHHDQEGRQRKPQSASTLLNTHPSQPRPAARSSSPMSPAVKELIQRQEGYIHQLEREAAFCKHQLATILTQVKDVLIANSNDDKAKKDDMIGLIKNIETQMKKSSADNTDKQKEENKQLRQKLASQVDESEAMKRLREELEVLRVRESEAAEQVQRSIKVAEQIKQHKSEAEFEVGQLRGQVERQQVRIRGLIEEQVAKVEEERQTIERRFRDSLEQSRTDIQRVQGENVRLTTTLDKVTRQEAEVRGVLEEKERILARVKEETDKRVGELQLEIVEVTASRHSVDRDINMLRLRLEKEKSDHCMEIERLQSEIGAVRGRLKFAEDSLVEQRGQNLQMVEAVAGLETELMSEKQRRENAEKRKIDEVTKLKSEKSEELERLRIEKINKEKRLKRDNDQLEDLVRRQRSIISELKCQCKEVTGKFEDSYNSWIEEKKSLRCEVSDLKLSMSELGNQVRLLESQNVDHIKLHQSLLGQINYLEENKSPTKESPTKLSSHSKTNNSSRTKQEETKVKGTRKKAAITIERAGKVTHLISSVN